MTNHDDQRGMTPPASAQPAAKKPYQTPQLTVHGRVEEITKFMLLFTSRH